MGKPIVFRVNGEPASKANQRKLVTIKGKPRLIKSAKALSYLDVFRMQCPKLPSPIEDPVVVSMWVTYASRRPDIDGGPTLILDAMQGLIYKNDRQVVELHVYKMPPDKENPSTLIHVAATD